MDAFPSSHGSNSPDPCRGSYRRDQGGLCCPHQNHDRRSKPSTQQSRLGGGALLDLGIYPISFVYDVLGEPATIMSTGRFRATGADVEVTAHFRFAEGASALVITASDAAGPNTASIHGTKGYVEIEGTWCAPSAFKAFDSDKVLIEDFPRAQITGRGMHFQALELEKLVAARERTSSIMPIAQSVAIMEMMDAIRKQVGLVYPGDL